MKIYLATDHAGFELKEKIKSWLTEWGLDYEDMGAFENNPDDDYPEFVAQAGEAVSNDPDNSKAIVLGGSGQGEAMVANRFQGVRAAVYYGGSMDIIKLSRQHNNANVLSLGARFLSDVEAQEAIKLWLDTPFTNEERHVRRINMIDA